MRRIAGGVLMLAAVLMQVTWAPRVEIGGAFPNLVLIAVVAVVWIEGVRVALVWSCVGGLLLDLTAAGPVGPHALALLVPVYGVGLWVRNLERPPVVHVAITAALTTVVYSVILVAAGAAAGLAVPSPALAARLALAAAAYNALLSPAALEVQRRLHRFTRPAAEAD